MTAFATEPPGALDLVAPVRVERMQGACIAFSTAAPVHMPAAVDAVWLSDEAEPLHRQMSFIYLQIGRRGKLKVYHWHGIGLSL